MKNNTQEKNKKFDARLMSFTAVAAIIGAGLAAGVGASAYGGMGMMDFRGIGSENRAALRTAIENDDYDAWSDVAEETFTRDITEERFNEMAERHKQYSSKHDAIEEAIDTNDYKTWAKLSSEFDRGRAFMIITEETFPTFVEMHKAMESGDFEKADELREELGLASRPQDGSGKGRGQGKGMGRGMGMNK